MCSFMYVYILCRKASSLDLGLVMMDSAHWTLADTELYGNAGRTELSLADGGWRTLCHCVDGQQLIAGWNKYIESLQTRRYLNGRFNRVCLHCFIRNRTLMSVNIFLTVRM